MGNHKINTTYVTIGTIILKSVSKQSPRGLNKCNTCKEVLGLVNNVDVET